MVARKQIVCVLEVGLVEALNVFNRFTFRGDTHAMPLDGMKGPSLLSSVPIHIKFIYSIFMLHNIPLNFILLPIQCQGGGRGG